MRATSLALIVLAVTPTLSAAITDLVASPDGKIVYFNGPSTPYVLTEPGRPVLSDFFPHDLAGPTGRVAATESYLKRVCGLDGSTCEMAPRCLASLIVFDPQNPKQPILYSDQRTSFVRLDPAGTHVWIEQATSADCWNTGSHTPYPAEKSRNGLYTLDGATQVAPRGAAVLANRRAGRRAIAIGPKALSLLEGQLSWIGGANPTPVSTTAKVAEAVTDASGRVIVYAEETTGRLHWIETSPFNQNGIDIDLGLTGSAPALTADGRTLVFLTSDNKLAAYDRTTRSTRRLGTETYTAFTLSDTAAFAATADNRVFRIELDTSAATELASHLPEITAVMAPPGIAYFSCNPYCYGELDLGHLISRGMLLQITGKNLDAPAWQLQLPFDSKTPLQPLSVSPERITFQIPSGAQFNAGSTVLLSGPSRYTFKVTLQPSAPVCLASAHQDYTGPVTPQNPAHPGEVVHVFLTGLTSAEPIADGQPNPTDRLIGVTNPPRLSTELVGWETLFAGLAPGLIAIQQLEIRVGEPATPPTLPLFTTGFNCPAPPVASPADPAAAYTSPIPPQPTEATLPEAGPSTTPLRSRPDPAGTTPH